MKNLVDRKILQCHCRDADLKSRLICVGHLQHSWDFKFLSIFFSKTIVDCQGNIFVKKPVSRADRENWFESLAQLSSTNITVTRNKCNFMTSLQRAYFYSDAGNFKHLFLWIENLFQNLLKFYWFINDFII